MKEEPREVSQIFKDIRALALSNGVLHCISSLVYRDWVLRIDTKEGKVIDDAEKRWSKTNVNKNELMLLVGLIVQSASSSTYSLLPVDNRVLKEIDRLLIEFHERLLVGLKPKVNDGIVEIPNGPDALGVLAREAIYYGAESFYLNQLEHFARHRYRKDRDWLVRNVGLSIRPILDIARFIVDRTNQQITALSSMPGDQKYEDLGALTNSLLISKADLTKRFGQKADTFISKFATPVLNSNADFVDPFLINKVSLAPLVDLGDHIYVPSQYRLLESIYESPFYWMLSDSQYLDTAAKNRGDFLEETTGHLFRTVFGEEHVFKNVTVYRNKKDQAGEIDVLVVFGEFAIIVQAKSKRVTLKARAGDVDALKVDFEEAIQAPYRQAYTCAELMLAGAECHTKDGKQLKFSPTTRVFPVVILSDGFPSATILSSSMLERTEKIAPVIWDIGVLDCVTRIQPTPVDLLYYLKCRSDAFDHIHSDSEYNFLGYHLTSKLALPSDVDGMILESDFATPVDDFMISNDMGIKRERPLGVLDRLEIPVISDLFRDLKRAPPELASVVIELFDFSSTALKDLSKEILSLRKEVAAGKELKSLSIETVSGGVSYVVCRRFDVRTRTVAEAIGSKYKYDSRRDRWYVIVDAIGTNAPVDALLPILSKWEENSDLAENSRKVGELFGSIRVATKQPANPDTKVS